jgi:tetratricopeptide (TPR) repeat protein
MKTKLDDILEKLSPEQCLYREDNDNDLEHALLMTEEASEKLLSNDPDGAFRLLKEAEKIKDIPQIHNELGKCMIEQNYPIEMAIKELKKAEALDPEGYPLIGGYLYIIETLLSRGDYEPAKNLAYKTDDIYIDNPFDYYQMGAIFKNFSKFLDAMHFFSCALNIHPEDPLYLAETGECYMELKDFENAINFLTKSANLFPLDPEAHALTLLSKTYYKAGDIPLARETAYKVLDICSDFFTCGINISEKGFISVFDKELWNAFIEKFPEMEDIKFGNLHGKESDFPNMGGIFI